MDGRTRAGEDGLPLRKRVRLNHPDRIRRRGVHNPDEPAESDWKKINSNRFLLNNIGLPPS